MFGSGLRFFSGEDAIATLAELIAFPCQFIVRMRRGCIAGRPTLDYNLRTIRMAYGARSLRRGGISGGK